MAYVRKPRARTSQSAAIRCWIGDAFGSTTDNTSLCSGVPVMLKPTRQTTWFRRRERANCPPGAPRWAVRRARDTVRNAVFTLAGQPAWVRWRLEARSTGTVGCSFVSFS
jgi:hypothetical protein